MVENYLFGSEKKELSVKLIEKNVGILKRKKFFFKGFGRKNKVEVR